MNFKSAWCFVLLISIAIFSFVHSVPAKKYYFEPAKCDLYPTDKNIGGPLKICTFSPRHVPPSQEDINAVIEHIQRLDLS